MKIDALDPIAMSVRQRLLNLANARNENYNLILTRYALERFLYRLSLSLHRQELIVKGAMLFQIWSETPHRATNDLDLLAYGDVTHDAITAKIAAICAINVEPDGLTFDINALVIADIREDDRYGGKRAKLIARLGSAKIAVQIDFGIGDVVTPSPAETEFPTLLDMKPPIILAYPRETVVAEKLETIVDLGMGNSRMKDYFDLWFIATTYHDDPNRLADAVRRTFARRQQTLPHDIPIGLSDEFANDPSKRTQWQAFIARAIGTSLSLDQIVLTVREFAIPLFTIASQPPSYGAAGTE